MRTGTSFVLALMLAAAAPLAASAAATCQSNHNHSCAHPGASCGAKKDPGHCQTIIRPYGDHLCLCHPEHAPAH